MFMTPGLALFYGGMVRAQERAVDVHAELLRLGLVSVQWAVVGYSLAFGGTGKWIGNFDFAWLGQLQHRAAGARRSRSRPRVHGVPVMFAVITPALITGAIAERMRFSAYVVFLGLDDARLRSDRALGVRARRLARSSSARSTSRAAPSCTSSSGISALVVRRSCSASGAVSRGTPMPPHDLTMTVHRRRHPVVRLVRLQRRLGARRATASPRTRSSTRTSPRRPRMLGWVLVERMHVGKATMLGAASGAVAGLVAITPCAGYVGGMSPIAIGAHRRRGLLRRGDREVALRLRRRARRRRRAPRRRHRRVVAARLLRRQGGQPRGPQRRVRRRRWGLLGDQIVAVVATLVYSFAVTFAIVWVLDKVIPGGLRVGEDDRGYRSRPQASTPRSAHAVDERAERRRPTGAAR